MCTLLHGSCPVFIGDKDFARDRTRLRRHNVRYVVNCTPPLSSGGVANYFEKERDVEYLRLPMRDANTESVLAHLPAAIDFLERARIRADGTVLIHCNEGKSRSCAVALGYVIRSHGKTLDEALEMLRDARPQAEPKEAFLSQLATLTPAVLDGVDVSNARKRAAESSAEASAAKRPAIGPAGPPERPAVGPTGPPERPAIGPAGPPQRPAIGPAGPPERPAIGPAGPPERPAIGPASGPDGGAAQWHASLDLQEDLRQVHVSRDAAC